MCRCLDATRARSNTLGTLDKARSRRCQLGFEIMAWVDAMPIAERLTVMRAMSFAFPMLKNDRAWKVRIVRAPGGGSDQIKKSPDGGGAQVGRLLRRTPPPIMLRTTQIPSCDADHVRALFFGRFSPE